MEYQLYYYKYIDNKKCLVYERDVSLDEYKLINECNKILGEFNEFCNYYSILESNIKNLENYIKKVETFEYRISSPFKKKEINVEINKLMINFASIFKTYLDYYEVKVKEVFGNKSEEFTEFKNKCSKYFDNSFEYRFLYNFRHYIVHYKLPVTKITIDVEKNKRVFLLEVDKIKEWDGWKKHIKEDIKNLQEDIDLSIFLKKCYKMLKEFNQDISYYNTSEVLGAIRIMKKYERIQETPYLKKEIIKDGTSGHRFISFFNDYMLSVSNILNLGVFSCSVYNKEYGLQIFDPFDLMFSKEEKKKLGLL